MLKVNHILMSDDFASAVDEAVRLQVYVETSRYLEPQSLRIIKFHISRRLRHNAFMTEEDRDAYVAQFKARLVKDLVEEILLVFMRENILKIEKRVLFIA